MAGQVENFKYSFTVVAFVLKNWHLIHIHKKILPCLYMSNQTGILFSSNITGRSGSGQAQVVTLLSSIQENCRVKKRRHRRAQGIIGELAQTSRRVLRKLKSVSNFVTVGAFSLAPDLHDRGHYFVFIHFNTSKTCSSFHYTSLPTIPYSSKSPYFPFIYPSEKVYAPIKYFNKKSKKMKAFLPFG
jgi:hypothetical protein